MSRNIGETYCKGCGNDSVRLVEKPRPITKDEAGPSIKQFEGMDVANAECGLCEAKFLAWVDETNSASPRQYRYEPRTPKGYEHGFFDLSWRSTFDDEPGDDDVPRWDVKPMRAGPYTGHLLGYADKPRQPERCMSCYAGDCRVHSQVKR